MRRQEMLGDDEPERGVTQQRQRFVVRQRRMLVGVGGVRQRALEQRAIVKTVAETTLER
jgi:hypothetical protein